MSFVSSIMSLAGTATQMFGQYEQGKSSQIAYDVQAEQITEQGKEQVQQIGEEEIVMRGRQEAAYARAGVMASGSALDVMLHTATNYEYDKLTAKYNTESAASAARYKGRMSMLNAYGNMGGTLTQWGVNTLLRNGKFGDTQKIPTTSSVWDNANEGNY